MALDEETCSETEKMLTYIKTDHMLDYEESSEVANFYANRSVFITGATGFIGKALVEKLVRSAKDIKKVYLLIREKRGSSINERLKVLTQSPIFNRIKASPGGSKLLEEKLSPIKGDITEPRFGISDEDMWKLNEEVSVVFNSAASIRFVEPLDVAVRNNVYSVSQLVELCNQLSKLEVLMHLSTAYSNCHKRDMIYETIYEPPIGGDQIIEIVRWLKANERSIRQVDRETQDLQEFDYKDAYGTDNETEGILDKYTRVALRRSNRPNVYTLTKAISEAYLVELLQRHPERYLNDKIPVAVIRPSIVGGIWREPQVGFVDNYSGPVGPILSTYTGALQSMPGNPDKTADIVPCDMVVNFVLSAASLLGNSAKTNRQRLQNLESSQGAYVFNFASGLRNPMRWNMLAILANEIAYRYPSKYLVRLPNFFYLHAGPWYNTYDWFNNWLPALIKDFVNSYLFGHELDKKSSARATYARIRAMTRALTPFTHNQWRWNDSNVRALYSMLSPVDRKLFEFNVSKVEWSSYLRSYIIGARFYTLMDDGKNLPAAIKTLKK